MKILQLISTRGFYGAEQMLVTLARELRTAGIPVEIGVIQKHRTEEGLPAMARNAAIPIHHLPSGRRFDRRLVSAIRGLVEAERFDLIHTHGYKSDICAWWASVSIGIPVIATAHNWTRGSLPLRAYEMLDKMALRKMHRVVSVSETVRSALMRSGIPAARLSTITNGVDYDRFQNSAAAALDLPADTTHLIGLVGRLVPEKGFQFMAMAGPRILRMHPRASFLIVGEGPYRTRLEQLVAELGITSRFRFAGHRPDMACVYRCMDVMVLPSLREATPMCILEAMAAGVPVIASAVGGIPDVISDGVNGRLVRPGSQEELENAVITMLSKPDHARSLAANGFATIRAKFSARNMATRYAAIYLDVLSQSKHKALRAQLISGREIQRKTAEAGQTSPVDLLRVLESHRPSAESPSNFKMSGHRLRTPGGAQ